MNLDDSFDLESTPVRHLPDDEDMARQRLQEELGSKAERHCRELHGRTWGRDASHSPVGIERLKRQFMKSATDGRHTVYNQWECQGSYTYFCVEYDR